eukprot:459988-Prymnesium_polylepis.1
MHGELHECWEFVPLCSPFVAPPMMIPDVLHQPRVGPCLRLPLMVTLRAQPSLDLPPHRCLCQVPAAALFTAKVFGRSARYARKVGGHLFMDQPVRAKAWVHRSGTDTPGVGATRNS